MDVLFFISVPFIMFPCSTVHIQVCVPIIACVSAFRGERQLAGAHAPWSRGNAAGSWKGRYADADAIGKEDSSLRGRSYGRPVQRANDQGEEAASTWWGEGGFSTGKEREGPG